MSHRTRKKWPWLQSKNGIHDQPSLFFRTETRRSLYRERTGSRGLYCEHQPAGTAETVTIWDPPVSCYHSYFDSVDFPACESVLAIAASLPVLGRGRLATFKPAIRPEYPWHRAVRANWVRRKRRLKIKLNWLKCVARRDALF